MNKINRIFLVGPMGAGKSTIGNRLARSLKQEFLDCDRELERRTGVTISLIFDIEGESGFREREKLLLDELTQVDGIVLATGGGAILDPENRRRLAARGLVIYLHTNLDRLLARTRHDPGRPLLQTQDARKTLEEILTVREPLYRQIADLIITTGNRTLSEVVKEIRSRLPE